ncbi:MAG TPA: signal peptidase I [Rubrobacteraceae bacterium]|nr:signal peptidase I [Rubrobacteraceae bacterium]
MIDKNFHERGFKTGTTPENRQRRSSSKKGGGFLEFLIILLVTFALVFGFVRPFVVEAFYIPSESMTPTLEVGDRVFVNKFVYRFAEPERGDIVVFKNVEGGQEELIKRVVGVPGDEVTIRNGVLFVNEERWEEPYINSQSLDSSSFGSMTVPEGKVFVMGDNRANSRDSRFFGPIPIENVEGEAFVVFWPPSHIGLL